MSTSAVSFDDLRAQLYPRILELVEYLAPGGGVNNGYYMPKNPTRHDRNPGSFWIRVEGNIGAWCDEATGDKGDLFNLIQYCLGLKDRREVRQWCLDWLGISGRVPQANLAYVRDRVARDKERRELEEMQRQIDKVERANKLWLRAPKITRDNCPEILRNYLNSRGLDLAYLDHPIKRTFPGAVRFLPEAEHLSADGEVQTYPCILTLMAGPTGKPQAVHRTWLAHDGFSKAPVDPPRKIWPSFKGAVMRLAKGTKRLSPEQAIKVGHQSECVITEGLEDGLTVAFVQPDVRVWAAGTLGNIGEVPVLPCVSKYIVWADNDWNNPQATQQFDKAIANLRARGAVVSVVRSTHGKDANDQLLGA